MAVKATVNKRPFKNCKWLKAWKMTDEENESYDSSVTLDFSDRLTTYTNSFETNSTPLYGDGKNVENAVSEGLESVSYGVHHVADDERADLYGETVNSSGAVISTGEDIPPYFCVAAAAEKRNGMLNLRKWLKVNFQKHEETVSQQENGGITYSMPTLTGNCAVHSRLGVKSVRIEVDPKTAEGAEFIENWYANAEYIGGSTMVNTSVIKVDNTEIVSGGTITSGDTVTFAGSATGGEGNYTYSFYYRAAGSDTWTTLAEDTSSDTATQAITVVSATDYEFRLVVRDGNGLALTKLYRATVQPSS